MNVQVVKSILSSNDQVAAENQTHFNECGITAINFMASPGAGKTSVLLATAQRLPTHIRLGVIEGDLASSIDADTIAARNIPVVQINTGGNCHLDAPMIRSAFAHLPLADIDLLLIENVGNLVCTANFALGAHLAVIVASVPEGHDKPYKYPAMFAAADVVLLNKFDLAPILEFDTDLFRRGVKMVNPKAQVIPISCRIGVGMELWMSWLLNEFEQRHRVV